MRHAVHKQTAKPTAMKKYSREKWRTQKSATGAIL